MSIAEAADPKGSRVWNPLIEVGVLEEDKHMTVLIVFAALAISLAEGIPLGKQGQWKELAVMSTLLGMTILLAAGNYLGLPSPLSLLERLLEPIGKAIFK
ncbi:hypothetical protein [Desulfosporosinus sp. OT]|uniref:hypothetical protein n=1 Tax=Desulfosporosinus sp. OT TaxID=913865 RepID=UPI0002239B4D|nr:hypothetical protein [Desulfosporosinus sp. OT]EGW39524.1 hypothetical protein DOT_2577 [Desulfosporosinus sp. OT]